MGQSEEVQVYLKVKIQSKLFVDTLLTISLFCVLRCIYTSKQIIYSTLAELKSSIMK